MTIQDQNVTIPVDGGEMRGFLCRDTEAQPGPAVIVVQEIFGVTPHIESVTRRVAEAGFAALAPDLFWKIGAPPDFSDRESFMAFRAKMDDREFLASLDATVTYLQSREFVSGGLGIVGFCMGGYYALLEAAHNPAIIACVDYYGGPLSGPHTETRPRTAIEAARDLRAPFLGLFGEDDAGIPVEQVRELESAIRSAGVPCEIEIYPGAGHAFNNDTRETYRATAAADAWTKAMAHFERYLGQRVSV